VRREGGSWVRACGKQGAPESKQAARTSSACQESPVAMERGDRGEMGTGANSCIRNYGAAQQPVKPCAHENRCSARAMQVVVGAGVGVSEGGEKPHSSHEPQANGLRPHTTDHRSKASGQQPQLKG
jgi:hypothetical protein